MDPRKPLNNLQANILSRGRGLPRIHGSVSMRSKKFASSSKTPKISNRIDATPPSNQRSFVTTRNRRLCHEDFSPFPIVETEKGVSHPTENKNHGESTNRDIFAAEVALTSCTGTSKQENCTDEDMDTGSDSEELMSPDGFPQPSPCPKLHHSGVTTAPPEHFKSHRAHDQLKESFESFLALPLGTPPDPQRHSGLSRQSPPPPLEWMDVYRQDFRNVPADDPAVLSKILRSGKHAWLGSEIGGDNLHQESLDGSDITQSTITDATKRPRRAQLMPSFEPREPPPSDLRQSSDKNPCATSELSSDMLEEYSLPDEQVNRETEIVIGGKRYLHRKLDPGWVVKVSKTHNMPFYVHPDFGTTWQCPNSLPPKSKARKFRRSGDGDKPCDNYNPATSRSRKAPLSPEPSKNLNEDLGTMSDLIKEWRKYPIPNKEAQDGYEASVSSNGSVSCHALSASDPEFSKDSSSIASVLKQTKQVHKVGTLPKPHSERNEFPEWITPTRAGIATPQPMTRRVDKSAKSNTSTPHLSPIEEGDGASPPVTLVDATQDARDRSGGRSDCEHEQQDSLVVRHAAGTSSSLPPPVLADRETVSEKSTPRVSFEPLEVDSDPHSVSQEQCASAPSASSLTRPGVSMFSEANTPTSDVVEPNMNDETRHEVVVGSIHHSYYRNQHHQGTTTLYTPREIVDNPPSEPRDPPKKRRSFSSLSRNAKMISDKDQTNQDNTNVCVLQSGSKSTFPEGLETGSNTDEWSPLRRDTEQLSMVTQERPVGPPLTPLPETNGFPIADDVDFSSPSISRDDLSSYRNDELSSYRNLDQQASIRIMCLAPKSAKHSATQVVQSPLSISPARNLPGSSKPPTGADTDILSPPRLRHTHMPHNLGVIQGTLSISPDGAFPESFEPRPSDDNDSDNPLPPKRRQSRKEPNWRVTHPFHPICALQRIEELLKEQRRRQRKARQEQCKKKPQKLGTRPQTTENQGRTTRLKS